MRTIIVMLISQEMYNYDKTRKKKNKKQDLGFHYVSAANNIIRFCKIAIKD